jgi:mannan endo-1,4-beta-mannosidase
MAGRPAGLVLLPVLLLALAACEDAALDGSPPPVPPCPALPAIEGFVRRQGSELEDERGRPVRALGTNVYYLQQLFSYAAQGGDEALAAPALAALDEAVCLGLPVVRTHAFNDSADKASIRWQPGVYREEGLRGLDRAVAEARRRGLRLILVLANNHPAYGGLPAYAAWAGGGRGPEDFFSDPLMQGYWKDYVTFLLDRINPETGVRYRDEPAVFAWEIANELRCPSCRGTTRSTDAIAALARHLRAAGARQLIADGGEGFDDAYEQYLGISNRYAVRGDEGMSFSRLARLPELDLISYHLYPTPWGLNAALDSAIWIGRHQAIARAAGKVAYLGELGFRRPGGRDRARAAVYDRWLGQLFRELEGNLALFWQLIPPTRRPANDDGYGVVPADDAETATVLYHWSRVATETP